MGGSHSNRWHTRNQDDEPHSTQWFSMRFSANASTITITAHTNASVMTLSLLWSTNSTFSTIRQLFIDTATVHQWNGSRYCCFITRVWFLSYSFLLVTRWLTLCFTFRRHFFVIVCIQWLEFEILCIFRGNTVTKLWISFKAAQVMNQILSLAQNIDTNSVLTFFWRRNRIKDWKSQTCVKKVLFILIAFSLIEMPAIIVWNNALFVHLFWSVFWSK